MNLDFNFTHQDNKCVERYPRFELEFKDKKYLELPLS